MYHLSQIATKGTLGTRQSAGTPYRKWYYVHSLLRTTSERSRGHAIHLICVDQQHVIPKTRCTTLDEDRRRMKDSGLQAGIYFLFGGIPDTDTIEKGIEIGQRQGGEGCWGRHVPLLWHRPITTLAAPDSSTSPASLLKIRSKISTPAISHHRLEMSKNASVGVEPVSRTKWKRLNWPWK